MNPLGHNSASVPPPERGDVVYEASPNAGQHGCGENQNSPTPTATERRWQKYNLESTVLLHQRTGVQEREGSAKAKRIDQAMAMRLLTEKQVSAITAIPTGTLRRWRCVGEGPPYIKSRSTGARRKLT